MQGVIYELSLAHFLFVTVVLGGAAAWMTGRAVALTWSSYGVLAVYLLLLTAAVRFIHMAPFGGTLLSLHYYLVDLVVVVIFGLAGYRATRANQMVTRYGWLFEANGPLTWRSRKQA